jgi:hypothetical protein
MYNVLGDIYRSLGKTNKKHRSDIRQLIAIVPPQLLGLAMNDGHISMTITSVIDI